MRKLNRLVIFMLFTLLLVGCQTDEVKVTKVTDGDTITVLLKGKEEKVRLIGVDTPETKHPNKPVEYYGKEASNFTKEQLLGKSVTLEFDAQERDKYGRLLAYVYVDGSMFNKTLISEGYGRVMTIPPNVKYAEDFVRLERQARADNRGLWNMEENKPSKEEKTEKININTATREELMTIHGVGEVMADRIIAYREQQSFATIEEIMKVKGIGEKTFEKIKDYITVD